MTQKMHYVFLISVLVLCGCSAHLISTKVPVTPASGAKSQLDGLFYALPQTVVTVKLPISVTKVTDGKHKAYAELFFPKAPMATSKLTLGTPEFSVRGEADPRQVYVVKVAGRGAVQQTLTFGFKEDGAVTGIKAEADNVTGDLVISGIKGLTGIATRAMFAGAAGPALAEDAREFCETPETEVNAEHERYFKQCVLQEERLVRNFDELLPFPSTQDRYLREYFSFKQEYRDFRRALASYEQIADLLEGRHGAVKTGDGGPKQDVILAQNQAEVAKLMQLFLGVKTSLKWTGNFELRPPECDPARQIKCPAWTSPAPALVTYAPNDGLCSYDTARHRGKAPSSRMNGAACAMPRSVTLSLDPYPAGDQMAFRLADNFQLPAEASLHFVVPLRVRARLLDAPHGGGARPLAGDALLTIAQRGIIAALPSDLGGKSFTHDLKYYQTSGALKSYTLVSKPLVDKGALDSLSGSVNELLDARNKQREAEANAGFNAVKRETETLELLLKKQKACLELTDPPEECEGL